MSIINVSHLSKYFTVYQKKPGFLGSLKSLFHRQYYQIKAVDDISFEIKEGELVGFIGPNGAGKTTTMKCLSGLLLPTKGQISILGYKPFDRQPEFLKKIALVMGQKNQLWWDLPPTETFLLNKEIYAISDQQYKKTVEALIDLLEAGNIINIQTRKLSLGQRMKCELIASLIHQPKVLFLDEPTIGLDVVMQKNLRRFIKNYNKKYQATILLTSHYMKDVEELCDRVIIINQGRIVYDGRLEKVVKKYARNKLLTLILKQPIEKEIVMNLGEIKEYSPNEIKLAVPIQKSRLIAAKILQELPVEDINIEDPDIEVIIREIFSKQ